MKLTPEQQQVADLGERIEAARRQWLRLSEERLAFFAQMPVASQQGVDFLKSVDAAERDYQELRKQWLAASERVYSR
jgi:hypothetical protein